ncbi:MAG: dehydrogenase [Cyanobacteria bacterium NC_groundwater_1444_Ag_S-0.65um_54_12]|nr:dehydrogenase [Cyanobacteria bacterium NC_groundwater_1444_Ag_S-0.65um_54_12]
MPKVFNWQIGREMAYPFEDTRPQRQFAMLFDTNKCINCQSCTVACKTAWTQGPGQEMMFWNNVETKPYGFYPLGWDVRILEKLGVTELSGPVYQGKTLFEAAPPAELVLGFMPDDLDYAYPNLGEDDSAGPGVNAGELYTLPHSQWMFYLARICNHCTYAACLGSCPRRAIYKRSDDGIVLLDQSRCRGYQECVKGCPYKKVYFNPITRVSEKCIGCYPGIENGRQTQCTIACIGKIRLAGFLSQPAAASADNPIDWLVHFKKIALPLYPQFGLEPNTYYIPPIHVPLPYLRQLFGHLVEAAITSYRKVKDEEDKRTLGAMLLFGSTELIVQRFAVKGDWVHGYDAKGAEVVRIPFTEQVMARTFFDNSNMTYRLNIT